MGARAERAHPPALSMIAVTGCGYVGSAGRSVEEALARCASGENHAEWMEVRARRRTHRAPVLRANVPVDKAARGLDRSVLFGLAAARAALRAADLERTDAIFAGTSRGPLTRLAQAIREEKYPPGDGPAGIMGCLSGALAFRLGLTGASVTVSASCTSSAAAIVLGAQHLLAGEAASVLVGGAEAPLHPAVLGPLATAGILGGGNEAGRACRPFDLHRDGTALGEGAAFLVLENWAAARARGAHVQAVLSGWALGTEPETRVGQEESGEHFAKVIAGALTRAGLPGEAIGYLNLHGTGTPLNDRAEAAAVARAFAHAVPCSSTKAVTGHCLGASSAMEAVISLAAMKAGTLPPTTNCETLDPVAPPGLLREVKRGQTGAVASISSGFWGTHAALIFEAPGKFDSGPL